MKQKKENRNRAKQQEEDDQVDEKENTKQSVFDSINLEERIRPGQVSFLDVDDDFDIVTDKRSNASFKFFILNT